MLNKGSTELLSSGVIDNDSKLQDIRIAQKQNLIRSFRSRSEPKIYLVVQRAWIRGCQYESEREAQREATRQAGLNQRVAIGKGTKSKQDSGQHGGLYGDGSTPQGDCLVVKEWYSRGPTMVRRGYSFGDRSGWLIRVPRRIMNGG